MSASLDWDPWEFEFPLFAPSLIEIPRCAQDFDWGLTLVSCGDFLTPAKRLNLGCGG